MAGHDLTLSIASRTRADQLEMMALTMPSPPILALNHMHSQKAEKVSEVWPKFCWTIQVNTSAKSENFLLWKAANLL